MPKGGLSYASKEQCLADAKRLGKSPSLCANLPSGEQGRMKGAAAGGPTKSNTRNRPGLPAPKAGY